MSVPPNGSRTPAKPDRSGVTPAREWLRKAFALLPVRFDDWHFWPRAALGLALRWGVLQGTWWPLRNAVSWGVAETLALVGIPTTPVGGATLGVGPDWVRVTVACTHLELVALLAPLLWDRTRSATYNVALIGGLGSGVVALSVLRIDLAIALLRAGVPWIWGHDGLLGIFYFVLMALTLSRGAWTRPSAPSSAPAA